MTKVLLALALAAVWTTQQASSSGAPNQAAMRQPGERQQKPKQLFRNPHKPIKELLKTEDAPLIELLDGGPGPGLIVINESGKLLESIATTHDLIALVEIADIKSELTPDETWITSTVSARIVEPLKITGRDPLAYSAGQEISFAWDGGAAQVGGRAVRARVSWVRHLEVGKAYLVFGWFPNGELRVSPQSMYEVSGNHLRSVSMAAGQNSKDDIETDTLAGVKRRIAAAVR